MKRIIILLAFVLTCISCEHAFRDELQEIHSEIDELRELISQANSNIEALQTIINAIQNNDFVTGIAPIKENGVEIGYIISFSKSGNVTIYHGQDGQDGKPGQDGQPGKDGYTPVISARQDSDGIWYWTLDGEWMTDENGQRIKAVGTDGQDGQDGQLGKDAITPQLKIENGYWFVSYDNGKSWNEIGKATGEDGKDGDPMFSNISVTEQMITLVLADGTEIEIPRRKCFELHLDTYGDETGALPGRQVTIKYTVANADSPVTVTASSDGRYSVSVRKENETQGTIIIDCPLSYKDGYVNVMACDETGYTILRVINFYEEKMEFATGLEYNIAPEGGSVKIPFRSNFDYYIEVENSASSWLKTIQTRAPELTDGEIEVSVSMNETFSSRRGKILVYPKNSMSSPYTEIIINQASAVFSLSQSKYAVKKEGDVLITEIRSTQGLTVEVVGDCKWINPEVTDSEGYNYILKNTVDENTTGERRNAAIKLYSGNGEIFLGMIEIVQVGSDEEDPNAMIFKVRSNFVNEFIVDLPLAGEYDCYVDWGDGIIEYCLYREKPDVVHIYENSSPASYIVKIVGKVPALNSQNVKAHSIEEVIQWGQTNLIGMEHAFEGNYLLRKIATDDSGSFAAVASMYMAFSSCTALGSIPTGLLQHCSSALYVRHIFSNCTNLKDIPADLFRNLTETTDFSNIFSRCSNIKHLPAELFKYNIKATDFYSAFYCCDSLEELPEGLFHNNPFIKDMSETFRGCSSLKRVPISIFDNNRKLENVSAIFEGCELEGESPYTIINGVKYHLYERSLATDYFYGLKGDNAFAACRKLTDYDSIPDSWR